MTTTRSARQHRARRSVALVLVLGLVAAASACSSDDSDRDSASASESTPATETTPTTEAPAAPPTTTENVGDGADETSGVRMFTVATPPGPGPSDFDEVTVLAQGSPDAANVLVLVPGTSGGATYFVPLGADVVAALDDWQVWSVDRRENRLEDHSMLDRYKAGEVTNAQLFDYYLRWLTDDTITERFEPVADDAVEFAREWGMAVAVDDLSAVVAEARALGGDVVLGGHSLGASVAVAYATWDFDGRAGVDDLAGLVLIDGGSSAGADTTVAEIEDALAELAAGSPFNDVVGLGLPWATGVFNALGSSAALYDPDEPSIAYDWPVLPGNLKPPVRPTNAAQYGFALDADTSPESLALAHMHIGQLAAEGDPRGWVDDELVPVRRAATLFSGPQGLAGVDGTEWYFPRRLSIDSATVAGGVANPAQELVGVKAIHGDALTVPILAIETVLGAGRVLEAARSLASAAGLDESDLTLVERHDLSHVDPLAAVADQNPFLDALVPYLSAIG